MRPFTFAQPLFQSGFVTGAAGYLDHVPDDTDARIVLPVTINGYEPIEMVVDTGSALCIVGPEIAEQIGLHGIPAPGMRWSVRRDIFDMHMARAPILLTALIGSDLEVEATIYVPQPPMGVRYTTPNFLGLASFLDRIRYAVDPRENAFYFGPQ